MNHLIQAINQSINNEREKFKFSSQKKKIDKKNLTSISKFLYNFDFTHTDHLFLFPIIDSLFIQLFFIFNSFRSSKISI